MILQELRLETIMDMQLSHVTIKNQTQKKIFHQTNQAGNWLKNFASIDQMPPCMVGPLNQSFHWSGPRTVVYGERERERAQEAQLNGPLKLENISFQATSNKEQIKVLKILKWNILLVY